MPDAAVAKTAMVMTTDASQMTSGMSSAASSIMSWASTVGGGLKTALGAGASAMSGWTGVVTGLVSGAITGGIQSLTDRFKELSSQVSECSRDARRLGTSTSDMMALQYAGEKAGLSYEDLAKSLGKARQNMTGDMVEGIAKLSDQITAIPDSTERARIAVEMFGKSGVKMLTLLDQGGDGFKKKMQEARDLGLALTDDQAASMQAAKKGLSQIGDVMKGAMNKIVVGLSPLVTYLAELFMKISPYIQAIGNMFAVVIEKYIKVLAGVLEIIITDVVQMSKSFMEGMGITGGFFNKFPDWGKVVLAVLKVMAVGLGYLWDSVKAISGSMLVVLGAMGAFGGKAAEFFGGGDAAKKFEQDMAKVADFGITLIATFGQTHDSIDKLFLKLNRETKKSTDKAKQELQSFWEYSAAGAMSKGSKEALSIEARWKTAVLAGGDPLRGLAKQHLAEAQKTNDILTRIDAKTGIDRGEKVELAVA